MVEFLGLVYFWTSRKHTEFCGRPHAYPAQGPGLNPKNQKRNVSASVNYRIKC